MPDLSPRIRSINEVLHPVKLHQRFWSKVDPDVMPEECWDWQAGLSTAGYGMISLLHAGTGEQHRYMAHQVAWLLAHGTFPPQGLVLRHTCDNPKCVNLQHLDIGTHKDNARDREERGRGNRPSITGMDNPAARFTPEQVRHIRAQPPRWGLHSALAREFGVSSKAIEKIRDGRSWGHLPQEDPS